ncbi:MAG: AAA family ATPase [Nitrospiria bacterium]
MDSSENSSLTSRHPGMGVHLRIRSDGISDRQAYKDPWPEEKRPQAARQTAIQLIDKLLLDIEEDAQRKVLIRLRERLAQSDLTLQQLQAEVKKLSEVVEKVTAPANRIGTLLNLPTPKTAHIVVGGTEYYANIDPRLTPEKLKVGAQILVNEAYVVIETLGYDKGGPIMKISDLLPDGRIRVAQEAGLNAALLIPAATLKDLQLKVGDEVRTDSTRRVAVERVESAERRAHVLERIPKVTWEMIGGQKEAIEAIRNTVEQPLLHPELYRRFQYTQPKGFLLYGPPGCGKTLIGKATAASLTQRLREEGQEKVEGYFLHIKGPEILNMWLGESERMVRDIFSQARGKRDSGHLPFLFIDEAESILGTRRSMRSHNILSTLVPMFCAEMDGIASLKDMVIILASNRPDLIDPAVLRPGRIDRKIKVGRPNRSAAREIFAIYLDPNLPLDQGLVAQWGGKAPKAREALLDRTVNALFNTKAGNRMIEVRLRSSRSETLYRKDLVNGAIIAAIVDRAKEKAIKRAAAGESEGLRQEDLLHAMDAEYKEGEVLPPTDILEDWLMLLDHNPKNVVGISRVDRKTPPSLVRKPVI